MAAETRYPSASPVEETVLTGRRSRVSWGGILAGFFCALAIQAVLTLFGLFWGLGTIEPSQEVHPLSGLAVGGGVYWTITSIVSLFIGGWIAARMAGIPSTSTSVIHGISVWALTTLLLIFMLLSAFGMAAQTTAAATRAAAIAAASTGEGVPSVVEQVDISQLPFLQNIQRAARERSLTEQDIRQEVRQMHSQAISKREGGGAGTMPGETPEKVQRPRTGAATDVSTGLDRLFGSPEGELSQEDRQELVSAVAQNFDVPERQAERIVDRWQTRWQDSTERLEDVMEDAQKQITQAAETGADVAAKASVALAIASVLGFLAAAIGGGVGRIGLGPTRYTAY